MPAGDHLRGQFPVSVVVEQDGKPVGFGLEHQARAPLVSGLLPSSWGAHINAYLPEQAGTLITYTQEQPQSAMSDGRVGAIR